jgi:hypothetical protein
MNIGNGFVGPTIDLFEKFDEFCLPFAGATIADDISAACVECSKQIGCTDRTGNFGVVSSARAYANYILFQSSCEGNHIV